MKIQRYVSDILASNMYLIREDDDILIIDPCVELQLDFDANSIMILLTHEHYDHISSVNYWKTVSDKTVVVCSSKCAVNITDPRKNGARYFKAFMQIQSWVDIDCYPIIDEEYCCEADMIVEDGEVLKWRDHEIKCFSLPGHSPGGMGYLIDETCFFSGDNAIPGFPIELRMFGGSKQDWEGVTRPFLEQLAGEIEMYPGHFDRITVEEWRKESL